MILFSGEDPAYAYSGVTSFSSRPHTGQVSDGVVALIDRVRAILHHSYGYLVYNSKFLQKIHICILVKATQESDILHINLSNLLHESL